MNKKVIGLVIIAVLIFSICSYGQHYVIKNINVVDVENGEILQNYDLEIEGDRIIRINKRIKNNKAVRIEGDGKYIIPGLWDMHVHLSMVGDASMPMFLNYGITGVRDMGGDIAIINQYKKEPLYPDIVSAGPILESPRFYQILKLLLGEEIPNTRVPYGDPEKASQIIDSLINSGSDFIKIRTVLDQDTFEAIGKASKDKGVLLAGHIDPNIDFLRAIQSGISSIEHSEFFNVLELDEKEQKELAFAVSKEDIYYTPTLIAELKNRMVPKEEVVAFFQDSLNENYTDRKFISSRLLENWKVQEEVSKLEAPQDWNKILPDFINFGKTLAQAGVPLLAGTDCGLYLVIPGKSLHEELELLVKHFEISNLAALQSATINAAEYLNKKNEGIVKAGAIANLVLLEGNPLEDIKNISKIAVVIKNGRIYTKETREKLREEVIREVKKDRIGYENRLLQQYRENLAELMKSQE